MLSEIDIDWVSLSGGYIIAAGEVVPVTQWLDEAGDECDEADAQVLVAGPTERGAWISVVVLAQDRAPLRPH